MLDFSATNPNRTLENYKALAAGAQTVLPGNATVGGGTSGTVDTPTGTTPGGDAASSSPAAAGAGMLSAPAIFTLLSAGAAAALFL